MTQPSDEKQPIKCRNCGHENLATATNCVVCDAPLTYTSRFQRHEAVPTGLLNPTEEELEQQHQEEQRLKAELDEKRRQEQLATEQRQAKDTVTEAHKTSHKCPDCGYKNRIGDFFCQECGANLSASPPNESPADITQQMKALKIEDIRTHESREKLATEETIRVRPDVKPSQKEKLAKPELKKIDTGDIPDGCFQFTNEMILRLTEIESGQYTEVMPTQKKPLLIGRSHKSLPLQPDVDLTPFLMEQHGVSRRHALIRLRDLRLEVQDLNSTNGTGINGFRFRPKEVHEVRNGDTITLGRVSLLVSFLRLSNESSGNVTDKLG